MGACDFSAVFSEICSSIAAGESVSQVEIYSLLFDNYYLSHEDEAATLDKSDINKRKQGKMNAHSDIIKYYCQDPEALAYDIETNIISLISDKYALRDTFISMVKCDGCSEEKKADTLSDTDDLPQFFANVIIHSFGHNSVQKNASPDISDRIISSVPKPCKTFSGREKELSALDEMLKAHDIICFNIYNSMGAFFTEKRIFPGQSSALNRLELMPIILICLIAKNHKNCRFKVVFDIQFNLDSDFL